MKKGIRAGVSAIASAALVSSLLAYPISAYASTGAGSGASGGDVSSDTNWEAPTEFMTNTVTVDDTLYKVITTWANQWPTAGPDYLGVSNSNQLWGSGTTTDLDGAKTSTMLGIWASAVNEVPNAYNWNYFYNLVLEADGQETDSSLTTITFGRAESPGYDTSTGVWANLKYRPEVIWASSSLKEAAVVTYGGQIRNLEYYTSEDAEAVTGTDNDYYCLDDENYNPYVMTPSSNSNFDILNSLYELAGYTEQVKEDYADYNSDGSITEDSVTWKTMNGLPRTTRYEASSESAMTARECALEIEKALKGSVYYTLAKIADGTVEQKKVAFICGTPDTTSSTCTVIAIDFIDSMSGFNGTTSGKVGIASLVADQLTTDTVVESGSGDTGTYTTYTATVDELLTCDYIWQGDGSLTTVELEEWLSANATTDEAKAALDTVECITEIPAMVSGYSKPAEKMIFSLYNISFFYPELFPDLELCAYWYDNVYHIYKDALSICMSYGMGNATMPSGTEVSDLGGDSYSAEDVDAKALEGYEYWASTLSTLEPYSTDDFSDLVPSDTYVEWAEEEIAANYLANLEESLAETEAALEEAQAEAEANAEAAATLTESLAEAQAAYEEASALLESAQAEASSNASALAEAEAALEEANAALASATRAANTMTVKASTKTVKKAKVKKKAVTVKAITVKKAKGDVYYKKASGSKKLTVNATTGKITVKKGTKKGTYKIRVKVTAYGNDNYKSASKTVTVKIKVK